ncbi:hypothetical protein [Formosa haliotis]|uniref:hypothetical protein n=1 Tax=Formosa haliotis TaxID=1555194 RepID=UPI000826564B|nr:hypothetical protein [Formosa haliotis]
MNIKEKYPYHIKNEDESPLALVGLYSEIGTYTVNKAIFSPNEDSYIASSIVPFHYPDYNTLF